MEKEYLDVIDSNGNPTGLIKTREEIHKSGDYHRVVHTWIYNKNHQILLQKRSEQKENHPGCWDCSSAGHIHALETSKKGALRELKEELGLNFQEEDLELIATIKRNKNPQNRELADIYVIEIEELPPMYFSDNEVTEAKFFSIPQIETFLKNKDTNLVYREEYPMIFQKMNLEKDLHS